MQVSDEFDPYPGAEHRRVGYYRWLRARWYVPLAGLLLGAVLGAAVGRGSPAQYEAETVVVARTSSLSADSFGSVAKTLFGTEPVLQPVIAQLGLPDTPRGLIGSGKLAITPVSGASAVKIVGTASSPELASRLSSAAADSFVQVAAQNGLGTFGVLATGPASRRAGSVIAPAVAGGLFGLIIGALIVLGLYMLREPVLSEDDARRVVSTDEAFTARVEVRPGKGRENRPSVDVEPRGLVPAIWRVVENGGGPQQTCVVIADGSKRRSEAARALATELQGSRPGRQAGGRDVETAVVRQGDRAMSDLVGSARAVVYLVPFGSRGRDLRRMNDELRVASGVGRRVLVLLE